VARPSIRDLQDLPHRDRRAVEVAIDRLVADPGSVDLLKLRGVPNTWRMRIGNWRVFLELGNAAWVGQALSMPWSSR
jgi:mRNA-degrading endonuclease RelE of RelBE toxin-antitoxin system